jgi:hypothetical protein
MKNRLFLKELGLVLIIKILFLTFIWWHFFSDKPPVKMDRSIFANTLFGAGKTDD